VLGNRRRAREAGVGAGGSQATTGEAHNRHVQRYTVLTIEGLWCEYYKKVGLPFQGLCALEGGQRMRARGDQLVDTHV
jgi:hypothetical protein